MNKISNEVRVVDRFLEEMEASQEGLSRRTMVQFSWAKVNFKILNLKIFHCSRYLNISFLLFFNHLFYSHFYFYNNISLLLYSFALIIKKKELAPPLRLLFLFRAILLYIIKVAERQKGIYQMKRGNN